MESQLFWLWYRGLLNLSRMAIHCPCCTSETVNFLLAFTTLLFFIKWLLQVAVLPVQYQQACLHTVYFIWSLRGMKHALGCWDKLLSGYKWKRWSPCTANKIPGNCVPKTDPTLRNSKEDICIRTLLWTVLSIILFASSYVIPDLCRPPTFPN